MSGEGAQATDREASQEARRERKRPTGNAKETRGAEGALATDRETSSKWCPNLDLNQGHTDFQSVALPTELFGRLSKL